MKKILFALVLTSMLMSCSKPNYEFNETEMKTIGGETVLLQERDDVIYSPEFGFGFVLTPKMHELAINGKIEIFPVSENQLNFIAYSNGMFDLLSALDPNEMTEEQTQEFTLAMLQYVFQACSIIKADIEVEEDMILDEYKDVFSVREKIAKTDKWAYYLLYNTDYSSVRIEDEESIVFSTLVTELQEFENNIIVFNPVIPQ